MLIVIFVIILIGTFLTVLINGLNKEKMKELKQIEFENQRNKLKIEEDRITCIQQTLIDKYGQPSKIININNWKEYDHKKYIIIFTEPSIVYLGGQEISFTDISSFKIIDNYQIKHGEVI